MSLVAARKPYLDIHIHLFGAGDSGSGCFLSKRITGKPLFKLLLSRLKVRRARTLDEGYVASLVEHLRGSGLSKGVILAQDAVYDRSGGRDDANTHVYVPNDYLFRVTSQYPDWMIPCVSINPDRRDCLDELEKCASRGARILKIHPPIQGVDLADRKHCRFFARCAALHFVVMVHTGHEHSGPVVDISLADPRKLSLALEQGVTVVACHCGTGWRWDRPDFLPHFLELARRHDRLWGDTSILGSPGRVRDFSRLLAESDLASRLLHGSDFPFPSWPLCFFRRIGLAALRLQREKNLLRRDLSLKMALGIGEESSERAYGIVTGETKGPGTPQPVREP